MDHALFDGLMAWYRDEKGLGVPEIAARENVSIHRVRLGLKRAGAAPEEPGRPPARDPHAVPLFGCGPFTPDSGCAHAGPIAAGSVLYCPKCQDYGRRDDPRLRRDPLTDPAPEPKPEPSDDEPESRPAPNLPARPVPTRKERRAIQFQGKRCPPIPPPPPSSSS